MAYKPHLLKLLLIAQQAEAALVQCDIASLDQIAAYCGALTDTEPASDSKASHPQQTEVEELQAFARLLENTRGTLKVLRRLASIPRTKHLEYSLVD